MNNDDLNKLLQERLWLQSELDEASENWDFDRVEILTNRQEEVEEQINKLKISFMGGNVMELKVRAWCTKHKQMVTRISAINYSSKGIYVNNDITCAGKEIVMLYTGFNDKHNKKIYDSDILLLTSKDHQCYDEYKDIVKFKNGGFYPFVDTLVGGRGTHADIYELYDFEVVGNIYENPELVGD